MSGNPGLTPITRVSQASRALADHSDIDDDEDEDDEVPWDSDEEAEVLLWDTSLGSARNDQLNDDEDFDTAALADSILDDMQRLNIGVPQLEDVIMGLVVNFWQVAPNGTVMFLLETSEIVIPGETLRSFCTETRLAPMRIKIPIKHDGEEDVATAEEEEGDYGARVVEIDDDDDVEGDVCHGDWIPERGYVNVLLAMYGQAPVIAGLLSEGFDLSTSPQTMSYGDETLESFNNHGKRIVWLDSAEGSVKRARGANGDAPGQSQDSGAAVPEDGMSGFAADGNQEWTNKTNRHDVVCSFEREAETGVLKQVRLALSLHAPRLRDELQAILATSRNTI